MADDLLQYYERELAYLRRLGAEFGERYPKVAARLQLEASKCDDPHVERILEGTAFLAARVHRRLDDDLPEISEALLDVLYPHHVRPVPSMTIAEFELDPQQGALPAGVPVPRGSELRARPVQGVSCRFRTAYDITCWPLTVTAARWGGGTGDGPRRDVVGAITLTLEALPSITLGEITLDDLRLHLAGESTVVDAAYELLVNSCAGIVVRDPDRPSRTPVTLEADAVSPVGFADDEALLPYPRRVFDGHRLLQELFVFPAKFRFVDLTGLGGALRLLGAGPRAEVSFLIAPFEHAERREVLEHGLGPRTFRLGCTPAVNLFTQSAEPILLHERRHDYVVVADARRRLEVDVWSIDDVKLVRTGDPAPRTVRPLYGHEHGRRASGGLFWQASRQATGWRSDGSSEMVISFADLDGGMRVPDEDVLSLRVTCSNGDLPSRLPVGQDERGDLDLTAGGPFRRIRCIERPTPTIQPPLGRALLWRLVSALSLNHVSLVDEGAEPLRELLRLHNIGNALTAERHIDGLVGVHATPGFARVRGSDGVHFARGKDIRLDFDEEQFPGGGAFLFAAVLERFLGLNATMNSFTRVTATSRQRRRPIRAWPARAGWRALA